MATLRMKGLLRLYPSSWRKRYGAEMEMLLDELPSGIGTALDLVLGAAAAYVDVIRGNRLLSTAGAFLHGLGVAVLVQSIAFVSMILLAQGTPGTTDVGFGPFHFVAIHAGDFLYLLGGQSLVQVLRTAFDWLPGVALLLTLIATLIAVVMAPRLLKTVR